MTDPTKPILTVEQVKVLLAPLNPDRVHTKSIAGSNSSYLEGWDIKTTLIRVFGFLGFSAQVTETKILRAEKDVPATKWDTVDGKRTKVSKLDDDGKPMWNWAITAQATVQLSIHPAGTGTSPANPAAVYTEAGVAMQVGPDHGEVSDFALKTAETDALKRAAIYLGTQFGLSLYDDGSTVDVVRRIFATGQTAADLAPVQINGQVPGTPAESPDTSKAAGFIARALPARTGPALDEPDVDSEAHNMVVGH